jgi:hypothetical protein
MATLLPAEYVYLSAFAFIGLLIYHIYYRNEIRTWNPEGPLFVKARKKDIPLLDMVDPGTNTARFVLGYKDKEDDPVYDKDSWGLHADPSYTEGDASPERHPNGLVIQHTSTTMTFPVSPKNALAQKTILDHRHDRPEFRELDFLDSRDLLILLNSPANHLKENAELFLEKYKPMTVGMDELGEVIEIPMEANDLIDHVKAFKTYCQKLPIGGGTFSYGEYFRNSPYAHSSQTTQRINHLFDMKAKKNALAMLNLFNYAIIACMILGATGVVIYIISMAAGK